jgi:hypothetical protein
MKRREFITLLGGAAAWPLAARAQQPERMRRIGVLMGQAAIDSEGQSRAAALRNAFQDLGWIDGRNVRFELRWFAGEPDRATVYARELVDLAPDVIIANTVPGLAAVAGGDAHHTDCIRGGDRSGWQRLCRGLGATGRQHHRVQHIRTPNRRQMVGGAQTDSAGHQEGSGYCGPRFCRVRCDLARDPGPRHRHSGWR